MFNMDEMKKTKFYKFTLKAVNRRDAGLAFLSVPLHNIIISSTS